MEAGRRERDHETKRHVASSVDDGEHEVKKDRTDKRKSAVAALARLRDCKE